MRKSVAIALGGVLLGTMGPLAAEEPTPVAALDELLSVPVSAASKLEQTSMRAPASVTVLTAEEIERYGWRTLAEALRVVTGLYLTGDRNYSYLGVRGFSRPTDYNNRVLVMLNGVRIFEDVFGSAAIGTDLPLDMRAIERIEISRGPGSVSFGTAAMLAVVNVVLRDPRSSSDRAVAVEAGDFGRSAATIRGTTRSNRELRVAWSAVASESNGEDFYFPEYDTGEPESGHSRGADWDRNRGLALRAELRSVQFTAYVSEREKGIPTGAYETDLGDRRTATTDGWAVAALAWERELSSEWSVRSRAQAGRYRYDGSYPGDGLLYLDSTDNDWWGAELQATWEPRPESRTTAGLEWREVTRADYRSFDELGTVYFEGDLPQSLASLYAEHEWQWSESLLLMVGARYDESTEFSGALSPRLALVYLPNRSDSLKLLAGRAFRAPSVYERLDGVAGFDSGIQSNVEAERIESLELAWERRIGSSLFGSVSAYRYRMLDLIDLQVDPVDGHAHYVNVDSATSFGTELELTARFPSGLWIAGSAGLQRSEDDGTGERLSNSPRLQVKLRASSPLSRSWRASTELLYESGRDTVTAGETDPFLVANAAVAWTWPTRPWTIELQVRNLFDRSYALPGGVEHRQPALAQEARSLTLRLEVRF